MKNLHQDYLRSILFGIQDSLVSTTGVVAGIATGTADIKIILLAGIVTIAVEALSMGAGQYLSERAVHQMDKTHTDSVFWGAVFMFLSYFIAGLLPIAPIIFLPYPGSVFTSIISALLGLFLLGFLKGKLVKVEAFRSGAEMFIIGGAATLIGIIVGLVLKI